MRCSPFLLATAVLSAIAAHASGPAQGLSPQALIAELARNQRLLREYGWRSRVEVTLAGERVGSHAYEARFAADGTIVRTPVAEAGRTDSRRGRPSKRERRIAETTRNVEELIGTYIESAMDDPQSAFKGARVTEGGPAAMTLMQARDVLRRGDTMKIQVDAASLRPRHFEVVTSLEGEPVRLRAEFTDLDGGPSYPARIVVETEIKEDALVVTTENSDYVRLATTAQGS